MRVLITGGTGSLGQALIHRLLTPPLGEWAVERLVSFARSEERQRLLDQRFGQFTQFKSFLGDVRDQERLNHALHGIDVVIHTAALKRVDAALYQPFETVLTNIVGTWKVIQAAIVNQVSKVLVISSDKAVEAANIYGATKACAEHTAVDANSFAYPRGTKISVVRYGNVLTSTGSAYWIFKQQAAQFMDRPFTITDRHMSRFGITMDQAVEFVLNSVELMQGGEIFVPKLPSFWVADLARAFDPQRAHQIIGKRVGGEKLAETLISQHEADRVVEWQPDYSIKNPILSSMYVVRPMAGDWGTEWKKEPLVSLSPVPDGFSYTSDRNTDWLSAQQLRQMLQLHEVKERL